MTMNSPDNASPLAALPPTVAKVLWLALIAVLLASAWLGAQVPASAPGTSAVLGPTMIPATTGKAIQGDPDLDLYRSVVERIRAGEAYYSVVAQEHRVRGYPLRPFVTVRLPTLAKVMATLGNRLSQLLLLALSAATLWAWHLRLRGTVSPFQARLAVLLLAIGLTLTPQVRYLPLHELWAGVLVALSLALHRPQRWWPSLAVAAVAVAIRVLALPFVLLMAAFALADRRWREFAAWLCLVLGFAVMMALHMQAVAAVVSPVDPASPAWVQFGGAQAALNFAHHTSALRILPPEIGFPLVPLCLLGWTGWKHPAGRFAALLLAGYGLFFALTGRPNNVYWGLIVTPLLAMGLTFLPQALRDLAHAARGRA